MLRTVTAVTLYRCRRPGYLSRPSRSVGGPLRSSASPVRRGGGRAPAADGESTGGRRASTGTPRARRRRTRSPARGSKSRSSSSRPPTIGLARVLLLRRRDERPPGRRFSVSVCHSSRRVLVTFECGGRPAIVASSSSSYDKQTDTLGGGSLGSCVDEERSQLR